MICPKMSRPLETYRGDLARVDCLRECCQLWWQCKDPEGQELGDDRVAGVATGTNNP